MRFHNIPSRMVKIKHSHSEKSNTGKYAEKLDQSDIAGEM